MFSQQKQNRLQILINDLFCIIQSEAIHESIIIKEKDFIIDEISRLSTTPEVNKDVIQLLRIQLMKLEVSKLKLCNS